MQQTAVKYAWPRICAAARRLAGSESTALIGSLSIMLPPRARFMICRPMRSKRSVIWRSASWSDASSGKSSGSSEIGSGPMPLMPTIRATRQVALWMSPPTPTEFSP